MTKQNLRIIILSFLMAFVVGYGYAADFVVVIDPGHGGKDAGCVGKKTLEKDVNLSVAKQLAARINNELPGVKAILTRSDDRFITLQQRANIANSNKGDLFISIHVNSVPNENPHRANVRGAQVYTLGPDKSGNNLRVAMRENSVIQLEKDYTQKYNGFNPKSTESYIMFELHQNAHMRQSIDFAKVAQRYLVNEAGRLDKGIRQDGFWVLWATSMPSVLVELDYICNPKSEEFLSSIEGKKKCANALFNAVSQYTKKTRAYAENKFRTKGLKNKRNKKSNKLLNTSKNINKKFQRK